MIETKVPKDIRVYETKIMGPFTLRNIICLTIMGVLDFFLYNTIFRDLKLSVNELIYILMIIDCPIAAIGWVKYMGMPIEQYLKIIITTNFLSPSYRLISNKIYEYKKVENSDDKKKKKKKITKKMINNHPEYIGYK